MFIIFDTETTGLPKRDNAPVNEVDNWPRVVQIAWQVHDGSGDLTEHHNVLIQPDGYEIPYSAEKVHGISTEKAKSAPYAVVPSCPRTVGNPESIVPVLEPILR